MIFTELVPRSIVNETDFVDKRSGCKIQTIFKKSLLIHFYTELLDV